MWDSCHHGNIEKSKRIQHRAARFFADGCKTKTKTKNKNPKRGYLRYSGRHLPTAAGKADCETSRLAFVFLPCECNNPVDGSLPAIAAHCFNFKNFNKLASAKRSNAVLLHLQQYHGKRYNKQPKPRHSPLLTQGNRKTHFSSNVLSIGAR